MGAMYRVDSKRVRYSRLPSPAEQIACAATASASAKRASHCRAVILIARPAPCREAAKQLVWRFRSPHRSSREFAMRTSEPKPHEINKLLVSFDSEVRNEGAAK